MNGFTIMDTASRADIDVLGGGVCVIVGVSIVALGSPPIDSIRAVT